MAADARSNPFDGGSLGDEATGSITHDIEQDVVVLRLEGHYTVEHLRLALAAAMQDDRISGPRRLLFDARQAEVNPSVREIRSFTDVVEQLREGFRFPIHMVVSSELHYGLGRMVSTYSSMVGMDVEVGRDLDAARQAMGLPPQAS
jgi:hypothetical protein